MHLQQPPDALFLALGGTYTVSPELSTPEVDAEERQVADERVVEDLEGERGERLLVARLARRRPPVVVDALDVRHLRSARA